MYNLLSNFGFQPPKLANYDKEEQIESVRHGFNKEETG